MKKLMIAAAIVCAAAMSQAAALDWALKSSTPVYAGYNASSIGGTYSGSYATEGAAAYLIYFNSDDDSGISQGDFLKALREGKTVAQAAGEYLFDGSTTIGADGKVTAATISDKGMNFLDDGDTFTSGYLAVIDGDNVYLTADKWYTYNDKATMGDATINVATSQYLRDNDGTRAYSSAGWYSTVPEPTSGLLLLLGVAGLALRRRRA